MKESLTTKNASETACGASVRDMMKAVLITGIVGGALALLPVSVRLSARGSGAGGGEFGLDDWTVVGTMNQVTRNPALRTVSCLSRPWT